jgi:2-(1,2-epoxy-1,2-dihydrophenyl)acetyl-CoA isomerase
MSYEKIRYELADGVAVITLADPATMNAAGLGMLGELIDLLPRAAGEGRAVVITGEGRGFCSGANLTDGRVLAASGASRPGDALRSHYNPFFTSLRDLPVPLVTAVNGAAAGIGCSLALMGDLIVAAESAYFLQAFRRIGLVPDGGSTYLLPRMIGRARAMEMMLLGERLPAAKAEQWGLVNRVVPDAELIPTAMRLATELAEGPKALALIRKATWSSLDNEWRAQLELEADLQAEAGGTADFKEGLAAFLEKRPAKFRGE